MIREDVLSNPRFGGAVRRYHTWPTLNVQTNADHTWNVMRIWWQLFGPLSSEESTYVIWHDVGEIRSGDLPFPVKRDHPALKDICGVIEAEALVGMFGRNPMKGVSTAEIKFKAKFCEMIEMCEFGLIELRQGNTFAEPIVNDTRAAAEKMAHEYWGEGVVLDQMLSFIKRL